MPVSHHKSNFYFVKNSGLLSIFAGILYVAAFFYIFIVLRSLGLDVQTWKNAPALLKWIVENNTAYSILWLNYSVAAILMLPVPHASSQIHRNSSRRSAALTKLTCYIGACGFLIILIASIIFYSVFPILSRSFQNNMNSSLLMYESFNALGIQLHLFGEFMVGIWLLGISVYLLHKNKVDTFTWYLIFIFLSITVITISKSFGFFDFELFLVILLAVTYIWLGAVLRKKAH